MIALFAEPVHGLYWSGAEDEDEPEPVTVIGLLRSGEEIRALFVDCDAIPHAVPWDQIDYRTLVPRHTGAEDIGGAA